MYNVICVTNRFLCREDFSQRLEKLAAARPKAIILREKDLTPSEYIALSRDAVKICRSYGTLCILHNFVEAAKELHTPLHLPLPKLMELSEKDKKELEFFGASCHCVSDALQAQAAGCKYITAGHIYDTDCKKGCAGRGEDFLRDICRAVSIPVYAIGGITADNIARVINCGAAGACVMSGAMTASDPQSYMEALIQKNDAR